MMPLRIAVGTLAMVVLASCNKSGTAPVASSVITVIITPSVAAVKPGEKVQLRATVAGPPGIPTTVTWRSNDPDLASVNGTGLVTGIAEGTASIRATWTEDPNEFAIAIILVTATPIVEGQAAAASPARRGAR